MKGKKNLYFFPQTTLAIMFGDGSISWKLRHDRMRERMYGKYQPTKRCSVGSNETPVINFDEPFDIVTLRFKRDIGKSESQLYKERRERWPNRIARLKCLRKLADEIQADIEHERTHGTESSPYEFSNKWHDAQEKLRMIYQEIEIEGPKWPSKEALNEFEEYLNRTNYRERKRARTSKSDSK